MRQTADPRDVRAAISYLEALPSEEFANAFARFLMAPRSDHDDLYPDDTPDPVPKVAAARAFRSTVLVERSIAACELLLAQSRNRARREGGTSDDQQRRRQHFIDLVGHERKVLGQVLSGYKAQHGIVDNSPNPTRRAQERWWQIALKDPELSKVALRLRDEEREKARARAEAEKAERARVKAERRRRQKV